MYFAFSRILLYLSKIGTIYINNNLHVCAVHQYYQKTLFIIATDAHYYKIVGMLKQFKSYNTCSDMFRFKQEPSSGSSPVLGLNYRYGCYCARRYAATTLTASKTKSTVKKKICNFSKAQDCSLMVVPALPETCRRKCYNF
jgi:hypothetical protein